ncbi:MAG: hypothetical protein N2C12_03235 [Planctomycetales bacterium]
MVNHIDGYTGVGHLVQLWVGKNFRGVRHPVQLRRPYQWVDSMRRRLGLAVGIPSGMRFSLLTPVG